MTSDKIKQRIANRKSSKDGNRLIHSQLKTGFIYNAIYDFYNAIYD